MLRVGRQQAGFCAGSMKRPNCVAVGLANGCSEAARARAATAEAAPNTAGRLTAPARGMLQGAATFN